MNDLDRAAAFVSSLAQAAAEDRAQLVSFGIKSITDEKINIDVKVLYPPVVGWFVIDTTHGLVKLNLRADGKR